MTTLEIVTCVILTYLCAQLAPVDQNTMLLLVYHHFCLCSMCRTESFSEHRKSQKSCNSL